jgi:crossover junction endodeoxyribonuclease RuvC
MIALGIDIGLYGAVPVLKGEELVAVYDMPCLNDGPARRPSINAPLLAAIIADAHATQAFVEFVAARPHEGAVGALRSVGAAAWSSVFRRWLACQSGS